MAVFVPEFITLHHSLSHDGKSYNTGAIRKWHKGQHPDSPYRNKPMRDIGYHFLIELVKDRYEIIVGRTWNEVGAHCPQMSMNYRSIGICFVGNYDIGPVPDKMLKCGLKLVRALRQTFEIPAEKVFGHTELASWKTCPGKKFNIQAFKEG